MSNERVEVRIEALRKNMTTLQAQLMQLTAAMVDTTNTLMDLLTVLSEEHS